MVLLPALQRTSCLGNVSAVDNHAFKQKDIPVRQQAVPSGELPQGLGTDIPGGQQVPHSVSLRLEGQLLLINANPPPA
jgi:hypothetical protein